jgi:exonuclease VII small subunit
LNAQWIASRIVEQMESGKMVLEDLIVRYEEGMVVSRVR